MSSCAIHSLLDYELIVDSLHSLYDPGGNDGIGLSITKALVKVGAKVAVIARDESKYQSMINADLSLKASTVFFKADLADVQQTQDAAKAAVSNAVLPVECSLHSFNH
jgi:NAD(P)-dependent dehydrogenase (short-subunit alcohol dehydrogenase family)